MSTIFISRKLDNIMLRFYEPMTDTRWDTSILSSPRSKSKLLKILQTACSESFDSIVFGMPIGFTHSCRKYSAFAQQCFSLSPSSFRRLLYKVSTIWTSDSSLLELLLRFFIPDITQSIVKSTDPEFLEKDQSNEFCFKFFKFLQYISQSYLQPKVLQKTS